MCSPSSGEKVPSHFLSLILILAQEEPKIFRDPADFSLASHSVVPPLSISYLKAWNLKCPPIWSLLNTNMMFHEENSPSALTWQMAIRTHTLEFWVTLHSSCVWKVYATHKWVLDLGLNTKITHVYVSIMNFEKISKIEKTSCLRHLG